MIIYISFTVQYLLIFFYVYQNIENNYSDYDLKLKLRDLLKKKHEIQEMIKTLQEDSEKLVH